jgi:hypothetical protein
MINNSPRSAPAASSATSNTPTARCISTELHRFTNPAEAAASLALRDGKPTALDFYLDHGRVHVGDLHQTLRMRSALGFGSSGGTRRDHARPHPRACRRTQPPRQ